MQDYRYSLEKYSGKASRYICPGCYQRTFVRYIDKRTNRPLSENTGKCNRIEKCGYHYSPKMYFEKNGFKDEAFNTPLIKPKKELPPSNIDKEILLATLTTYDRNHFAVGLYQYFNQIVVDDVLRKYYVGTAKENRTVFWQVNRKGEVRAGKIMSYDPETLKRGKYFNWVHKVLKLEDFNLKQVFFGSHLLEDTSIPVAIAEGEKNAIFGALYYPQYNWIAVGSIEMLNYKKINALKGYRVTLFPDKGKGFVKWTLAAEKANYKVTVNNLLENTNLEEGADIADLIISIKKDKMESGPEAMIKKLINKNSSLKALIKTFDLQIDYFF